MAEITHNIIHVFGTISESHNGWTKELNLISWNDKEPKYDIRTWSPGHDKMGKGVALSKDEILKLAELIKDIEVQNSKRELEEIREIIKKEHGIDV